MPTYKFRDKNTNKEWTDFMGISAMEKFLAENPHIEQLVNGCPNIIGGYNLKPDNTFRDVLKEIKKKHPKGNIETF